MADFTGRGLGVWQALLAGAWGVAGDTETGAGLGYNPGVAIPPTSYHWFYWQALLGGAWGVAGDIETGAGLGYNPGVTIPPTSYHWFYSTPC